MKRSIAPPPVPLQAIDNVQVANLLRAFTNKPAVLDRKYNIYSLQDIKEYLELSSISEKQYVKEKFDCDNFALELYVDVKRWAALCPIGFTTGTSAKEGSHAWNCIIVEDAGELKLLYIEPQSDEVFLHTTEKVRRIIM